MFHGLAAYLGGKRTTDILRKVGNVIGNEVCCSDKAIGPIGLYVSGHVIAAFSRDVWSYVEGEKRNFDGFGFEGALMTEDPYYNAEGYKYQVNDILTNDWENVLKEKITVAGKNYRYSEIFMTPNSIDAVWIKSDADVRYQKLARVIARKHNVPVVVVNNDSNALNWR